MSDIFLSAKLIELIERIRDDFPGGLDDHNSDAICELVALLPPPKRWTDEDVELVGKVLADAARVPNVPLIARTTIAVLTALDEAGRLKEIEPVSERSPW